MGICSSGCPYLIVILLLHFFHLMQVVARIPRNSMGDSDKYSEGKRDFGGKIAEKKVYCVINTALLLSLSSPRTVSMMPIEV